MKIKRCAADTAFSTYIRARDKWQCQRCLKQYAQKSQGLHCSHFHSRKKESVRFDPENCDALCMACHIYFGGNPLEYVVWKRKQLGYERFDALSVRAHQYKKKDRKMELIKIKALTDGTPQTRA